MSVERISITASDGSAMAVQKYQDKNWPGEMTDIEDRLAKIAKLEGKDGDVILCSYPKTGTNWVFDMLTMLKNNKAEIVPMAMGASMLDMSPRYETILAQPEPRTFVSHLPVGELSSSLLAAAKTVLVCRNPKDACVSMMHHMKKSRHGQFTGSWNGWLELTVDGKMPYGSYFSYYRGWDKTMKEHPEYKILLVYYEDFHLEPIKSLRTLCDFLGYERTDEFLQSVRDTCKIDNIMAVKNADPSLKPLIANVSTDGKLPFFRKGVIGDWRNHFTVAQNEMFDRLLDSELKDTVYSFSWNMAS